MEEKNYKVLIRIADRTYGDFYSPVVLVVNGYAVNSRSRTYPLRNPNHPDGSLSVNKELLLEDFVEI